MCAPDSLWCAEMESISSILRWLWGTRALALHRSLSGHMTHLSKYAVRKERFNLGEILPCSVPLYLRVNCFTLIFTTDMPSEKATVSSKSSKISKKRNRLSLILELKVMWTLLYSMLVVLEVDSSHCLPNCMCAHSSLQGSMEVSCSGWGQWMAWHFMTGRTQNWSAASRSSPNTWDWLTFHFRFRSWCPYDINVVSGNVYHCFFGSAHFDFCITIV